MERIIDLPLFGILITLAAYYGAQQLYAWRRRILFNPILISSVGIIAFLVLCDVDYESYNIGGQYLSFFLGPSVVALGVLFYDKYPQIKNKFWSFLISVLIGGMVSITTVICLCLAFSLPEEIIRSLALQSVTSPIAIEVSTMVGGEPALTAGIVILVGIFGHAVGVEILRWLGITKDAAVGTGLGTTSHGIGTARALELNPLTGAFSGVAMCINGVLTALAAPWILDWCL